MWGNVLGEPPGIFVGAGMSGADHMNSKGGASGVKAEAKHSLRIGVIRAGVMGSNHAPVLAGLPNITLVGAVDPLPARRTRATALTTCRTFARLSYLLAGAVD